MEVIRINLGDDPNSVATVGEAWSNFVNAMLGVAPVTSGMSVNLKDKLYMGTIGWKSLEVRMRIPSKIQITKHNRRLEKRRLKVFRSVRHCQISEPEKKRLQF